MLGGGGDSDLTAMALQGLCYCQEKRSAFYLTRSHYGPPEGVGSPLGPVCRVYARGGQTTAHVLGYMLFDREGTVGGAWGTQDQQQQMREEKMTENMDALSFISSVRRKWWSQSLHGKGGFELRFEGRHREVLNYSAALLGVASPSVELGNLEACQRHDDVVMVHVTSGLQRFCCQREEKLAMALWVCSCKPALVAASSSLLQQQLSLLTARLQHI